MRTTDKPTEGQLRELYEAAVDFNAAKPWKWLYDSDLICVENPEDGMIGYCSVMGRSGTHFALGVFLGEAGIAGFSYLMESGDTIPYYEAVHHQDALMASFEDRDVLDKKDRDEIKELGLTFRGRNAWPQFRRFEPGYFPWFINREECSFLIHALQQTLIVAKQYQEGQVKLDYLHGKSILRYSEKANGELAWHSRGCGLAIPHLVHHPVEFTDDLLVQRLKRISVRTNSVLQVDTCYLPMPVQETKNERPYFPRAFIVAEKRSGLILDYSTYQGPEHDADETLARISDLFLQRGIPKEIQVRPGQMASVLEDFCGKIDLKLRVVERLASIESFIGGLIEEF